MKRALVTGGAGFIGSHLISYLLEHDNKVYCLDDFTTGTRENIKRFIGNPNFEFIEHNIINPIDIEVDEIYNFACPASPYYYQLDPIKTIRTSFEGTYNMLELAKKYNAKILQASTSEVYGDPIIHPQKETYNGNVSLLGIRACYDEGKRAAETLCMDYFKQHNVKIKIIRIFNTYGPNMRLDDGRVVSNFIIQALQDKDITIYGDGKQTRCFQYVTDLISGIIKMMETEDDFTGPVNLGNPNEFTIGEFAEYIVKAIDSKSKIIYEPLPEDDPKKRKPDISLAMTKLNWKPIVGLDDGVRNAIAYFKEKL